MVLASEPLVAGLARIFDDPVLSANKYANFLACIARCRKLHRPGPGRKACFLRCFAYATMCELSGYRP